MALTIPEFLQVRKYPAIRLRQVFLDMALQSGVVNANDFKVVQRAASANMSVDVGIGSAWVAGSVSARQGMYHAYNDAVVNLTIGANATGNPRIDQLVLRIYDSVDGAAGQDTGTLEVIPGTATAAATLDNRSGAAALPASSIRLADILVANGAASITNAAIRDRRPWARGGYSSTAVSIGTNTALAVGAVEITGLRQRMEITAPNVRLSLRGTAQSSVDDAVIGGPTVDGTYFRTAGWQGMLPTPNRPTAFEFQWEGSITPGSHLFSALLGAATANAALIQGTELIVQEIIKPAANNGTA